MISILLPILKEDIANNFYVDIMGFYLDDGILYLPDTDQKIELLYQFIRDEQLSKYSYLKYENVRYPLFRYYIKTNFLTFIKKLVDNNVIIVKMFSHPGGYFALIQDPFYNAFEVMCEDFDDENSRIIDPLDWDFYRRF